MEIIMTGIHLFICNLLDLSSFNINDGERKGKVVSPGYTADPLGKFC